MLLLGRGGDELRDVLHVLGEEQPPRLQHRSLEDPLQRALAKAVAPILRRKEAQQQRLPQVGHLRGEGFQLKPLRPSGQDPRTHKSQAITTATLRNPLW